MCETKTEDVCEDFSQDKETVNFSNYSTGQNIIMIQTN